MSTTQNSQEYGSRKCCQMNPIFVIHIPRSVGVEICPHERVVVLSQVIRSIELQRITLSAIR